MWLITMFDLPVDTKEAREDYRKFVKALFRDGFDRMQFSIYIRYCASEENAIVHRKRVANAVPPDGLHHRGEGQHGEGQQNQCQTG